MKHSKYQTAIFDYAEQGSDDAAINAVAGSGKTTTGVDLCKKLDLYYGRFMAFNRHIKEALAAKAIQSGVRNFEFSTYNGFGNSVLMSQLRQKPRLNENKDKNILIYKVVTESASEETKKKMWKWLRTITRLISLFKNMNIHHISDATDQLPDIIDRHDIEIPTDPLFIDWLMKTFLLSINDHSTISYDDQKYLPLHLNLMIPQSDVLILDEYQDTCDVESELILRSCVDGRVFVFGDPDQCIYSFKGTTPNAMEAFASIREAVQLPLSICYRCPKAVVVEAQKYVPRIEYADWAIEGEVDDKRPDAFFKMAATGDMILGRVTVDLVTSCLRFIRDGREAYVEGREIGKSLEYLVDKVATNDDVKDFIKALTAYHIDEAGKLEAAGAESRLINLDDRVETIKAIAEASDSVTDIRRRLLEIFPESGSRGIRHMTIHKAKGLETDGNVFLLAPEKIPHKKAKKEWQVDEEYRLMYVAITRAKKGFYYVR